MYIHLYSCIIYVYSVKFSVMKVMLMAIYFCLCRRVDFLVLWYIDTICIFVYVCIHILYVYACICMDTICIFMYMYTYTCIFMCIYVCYGYIHVYVYVYYMCIHVYVWILYVYSCICIRILYGYSCIYMYAMGIYMYAMGIFIYMQVFLRYGQTKTVFVTWFLFQVLGGFQVRSNLMEYFFEKLLTVLMSPDRMEHMSRSTVLK